jgi:hypothetical protein
VESSFIDLCDSSEEDGSSLPIVVVFVFLNSRVDEEQALQMEVPLVILQTLTSRWKPQVVTSLNVVDLLKAMSLTSHVCSKLKSINYGAIRIEFLNCLSTKFNGDILFELSYICHPLGHFGQLQGMDKKFDGHVWCKL